MGEKIALDQRLPTNAEKQAMSAPNIPSNLISHNKIKTYL